jgi:hypothetical protein
MCENGEKVRAHGVGCDSNCPIYRIYQNKYFLQILMNKKDVLVNPSCWEDPFDNFLFKCTEVVLESGEKMPLYHVGKNFSGNAGPQPAKTTPCGGYTVRARTVSWSKAPAARSGRIFTNTFVDTCRNMTVIARSVRAVGVAPLVNQTSTRSFRGEGS